MPAVGARSLNAWMDGLPRTEFSVLGRPVPAYRALGVAGYYVALATALFAALLRGLDLVAVVAVAAVGGLSFFAWAWIRKLATGHEEIALLEHVWVAFACALGVLRLLGAPPLPYLDVFAVSLCPFLAAGRIGCLLVGCCHGRPSSTGITYPDTAVRDGFSPALVGVRLFPVQALEALGLLLIWISAFVLFMTGRTGAALTWVLAGYAVLRFGLDGLRWDGGSAWLGFSQARWMCLVQLAGALVLWEHLSDRRLTEPAFLAVMGALVAVFAFTVFLRVRWDLRRRLRSATHLEEISGFVSDCVWRRPGPSPGVVTTSCGMTIAVSTQQIGMQPESVHESLSFPAQRGDIEVLCDVAARTLPLADNASALYTPKDVLHLLLPGLSRDWQRPPRQRAERIARRLVAMAARAQQSEAEGRADLRQADHTLPRSAYFQSRRNRSPGPA